MLVSIYEYVKKKRLNCTDKHSDNVCVYRDIHTCTCTHVHIHQKSVYLHLFLYV